MYSMTVKVRRLVWDGWNSYHIAKHEVIPEEVAEAVRAHGLVLAGYKQKRLIIVGPTAEGRILEVVLQRLGRGEFYALTAYDAGVGIQRLYRRKTKGGETR